MTFDSAKVVNDIDNRSIADNNSDNILFINIILLSDNNNTFNFECVPLVY